MVTILSDIQLIVDDHKDEYGIRTADTLGRNFYKDDVLNTASTLLSLLETRKTPFAQFLKNAGQRR